MVGYSSIATIGLRPPPDDVGRQRGCKVRIARNPPRTQKSGKSRVRTVRCVVGDFAPVEMGKTWSMSELVMMLPKFILRIQHKPFSSRNFATCLSLIID